MIFRSIPVYIMVIAECPLTRVHNNYHDIVLFAVNSLTQCSCMCSGYYYEYIPPSFHSRCLHSRLVNAIFHPLDTHQG